MTEADLAKAQRAHESAAKRYERTREVRNALVGEALAAGWTHAVIAQATGLSRGRISQIQRQLAIRQHAADGLPHEGHA